MRVLNKHSSDAGGEVSASNVCLWLPPLQDILRWTMEDLTGFNVGARRDVVFLTQTFLYAVCR